MLFKRKYFSCHNESHINIWLSLLAPTKKAPQRRLSFILTKEGR